MEQPANRKRLEFAAICFVAEMRRQSVKQNPQEPSPVKQFEEYSPAHRSALMEAIKVATTMMGVGKEQVFEAWLAAQSEGETQL